METIRTTVNSIIDNYVTGAYSDDGENELPEERSTVPRKEEMREINRPLTTVTSAELAAKVAFSRAQPHTSPVEQDKTIPPQAENTQRTPSTVPSTEQVPVLPAKPAEFHEAQNAQEALRSGIAPKVPPRALSSIFSSRNYASAVKSSDGPEGELRRLKRDKQKLIDELRKLEHQYESLWHDHNGARQVARDFERQCKEALGVSQLASEQRARAFERCQILEKDNDDLRNQIASMSSAQQPVHDEDYYILQFDEVKNDVERWAVTQSRDNTPKTFSDGNWKAVIDQLASLGKFGKSGSQNMTAHLFAFYKDRRTRIALIRHVIGLFLFHEIFDKFALGMKSSDFFKWIEIELFTQDLEMSKILMARQAFGRAALSSQKSKANALRLQLFEKLTILIRALLPRTSDADLKEFVTSIITKSVTLKNAMTEEQAVYRCYLVDNGDDFKETIMQVAVGEDPAEADHVLMCMFPGLRRLRLHEEEMRFVIVVKAIVKLESSFVIKMEPEPQPKKMESPLDESVVLVNKPEVSTDGKALGDLDFGDLLIDIK